MLSLPITASLPPTAAGSSAERGRDFPAPRPVVVARIGRMGSGCRRGSSSVAKWVSTVLTNRRGFKLQAEAKHLRAEFKFSSQVPPITVLPATTSAPTCCVRRLTVRRAWGCYCGEDLPPVSQHFGRLGKKTNFKGVNPVVQACRIWRQRLPRFSLTHDSTT
jgi:hypothetical protein